MDVFISWSGDRSRTVATALQRFLRQMLQAVNPWLSIEIIAGTRRGPDIAGRLEAIDFGILCLTNENKDQPWILFEAGAISKKGQSRVIPFLLGMDHDDIEFPLRQFNCCKVEERGVRDMTASLNQALGVAGVNVETFELLFAKLWPEFDAVIKAIPEVPSTPTPAPPVEDQMAQVVKRLAAIETQLTYRSPLGSRRNIVSFPGAADWVIAGILKASHERLAEQIEEYNARLALPDLEESQRFHTSSALGRAKHLLTVSQTEMAAHDQAGNV